VIMMIAHAKWLSAMAIILLGFAFPAILAYLGAVYQFNIWYVGIFTFLSLVGAVLIPITLYGITGVLIDDDQDRYREQVDEMEEALASLLKRVDEIVNSLKEVDAILKTEE